MVLGSGVESGIRQPLGYAIVGDALYRKSPTL
jgi:hypothetical protein